MNGVRAVRSWRIFNVVTLAFNLLLLTLNAVSGNILAVVNAGIVSHNPNDAEQGGYCGACHWFTGDPVPGPPHLEAPCEARTAALMREWRARG